MRITLPSLLCPLVVFCGQGFSHSLGLLLAAKEQGADLMAKPGGKNGLTRWTMFDGTELPGSKHDGSPIYLMKGSPYGMNGAVEVLQLIRPETGRRIVLEFDVKGTAKRQTFTLESAGIDSQLKPIPIVATWEDNFNLYPTQWTHVRRELVLPSDANHATIVLHNPNTGQIFLTGFHLRLGDRAPADAAAVENARKLRALAEDDLKHPRLSLAQQNHNRLAKMAGPSVIRLVICAPLQTKKTQDQGIVTFPIPNMDANQVPIDFKVESEPKQALMSFKWRPREDGKNMLCDVTVRPGTKGSWIKYEALILVDNKTSHSSSLKAPTSWTQSTACVQSADPEIQKIAHELAEGTKTTEDYAHKVFEFVRDNRGQGKPFTTLDAKAALACEGSCTNRANLSAALLRAQGIPARTVAHMPTWCGKLYEHWLAEYWDPASGWVAFDPSLGTWNPDRRTRVVLNIASEADEDKAFDPLHERFVMPGAPYLSVAELTSKLYPAELGQADDAINFAEQVASIPVAGTSQSRLFEAARRSYVALASRCEKGHQNPLRFGHLLKSVKAKSPVTFINALKSQ